MGNPTPKQPIVLNADGSISALVFRGRTLRMNIRHAGLTDSTGYKARFAMTTKYDTAPIVEASSDAGTITFEAAVAPLTGTWVKIAIPDETMTLDGVKGGKLDILLEEPSGQEIPFVVGDFIVWKNVAE